MPILSKLRRLFGRTTYVYYRQDLSDTQHAADSPRVETDRYDLLLAEPEDPASPRHDPGFAGRAAQRRSDPGTTLYTITREGEMAHWGWMTTFAREHRLQSVGDVLRVERPGAILVDFYTEGAHRRGGLYAENIRKMLHDAAQEGVEQAFIATRIDNMASRSVVERSGFTPFRVYTRYRLWRWKRSRVSAPDHVEPVRPRGS